MHKCSARVDVKLVIYTLRFSFLFMNARIVQAKSKSVKILYNSSIIPLTLIIQGYIS